MNSQFADLILDLWSYSWLSNYRFYPVRPFTLQLQNGEAVVARPSPGCDWRVAGISKGKLMVSQHQRGAGTVDGASVAPVPKASIQPSGLASESRPPEL
jgi:hypothetical protein